MTLTQLPEHGIKAAHIEPTVAHLTFANETGMLRFINDNRMAILPQIVRWNVDWEPMLTATAAK